MQGLHTCSQAGLSLRTGEPVFPGAQAQKSPPALTALHCPLFQVNNKSAPIAVIDVLRPQSWRAHSPAFAQEGPCPHGQEGRAWPSPGLPPPTLPSAWSGLTLLCGFWEVTPLSGLGTVTSGQGRKVEPVRCPQRVILGAVHMWAHGRRRGGALPGHGGGNLGSSSRERRLLSMPSIRPQARKAERFPLQRFLHTPGLGSEHK